MRPLTRPTPPVRKSNRDPSVKRVRKPTDFGGFAVGSVRESKPGKDLYGDWRGVMIAAWGKYCSYCEIAMGTSLQVEHKTPKSRAEDSEAPYAGTNWDNLLLSCPSCNLYKKVHPDPLLFEVVGDYLWPDADLQFCTDPSYSAFEYYLEQNVPAQLAQTDANGTLSWNILPNEDIVLVRAGSYQKTKAQKTLDMLNLNGNYDSANNRLNYYVEDTDRRLKHRTKAWQYALAAAQRLDRVNKAYPGATQKEVRLRELMERQITSTAVSAGFWSVWLTVFAQQVAANHLALAGGDTVQELVKRLFIPGIPSLGMVFPGTARARIGIAAIGDLS